MKRKQIQRYVNAGRKNHLISYSFAMSEMDIAHLRRYFIMPAFFRIFFILESSSSM